MKSIVIILGVVCLGIAAAVIYTKHKNAASSSAVAETDTAPAPGSSDPTPPPKTSLLRSTNPTRPTPRFLAAARHTDPSQTVDPAARALKDAVEQIVSPNVAFKDKQQLWNKLIAEGRLDETIEALKQGATNNPDSADYQAALGEANLKKAGIVSQKGGASTSDLAILGMTADQSFDNALKIDPANWDAQFFKAVAMSYWPAELNKGSEVVQRLSGLITQQETQTTRPEFSLPYIALGQQYQKLGQTDNALQTWQAGAAKFPDDTTLQQKLATAQTK